MRIALLLSLLLSATHLWAQEDPGSGVYLLADYGVNRFDTGDMNQFVNTFNGFWGDELSDPYASFSGTEFSHPSFGAGLRMMVEGPVGLSGSTEVLWGRDRYRHQATWKNGVKNELFFKTRDVQWNLSLGLVFKSRFFVEGVFGGYFRKMYMEHATIYQDGSRSLSSEYKLNGLYFSRTSSIELGWQAGVRLGPVIAFVKRVKPMKNFPPGKGLVTHQDYDTPNNPPTDFPADYELYATDPVTFAEQNAGVKSDSFAGPRFSFGVQWVLGSNKDK